MKNTVALSPVSVRALIMCSGCSFKVQECTKVSSKSNNNVLKRYSFLRKFNN